MNCLAENINTNNVIGFKNHSIKEHFNLFLNRYERENTKYNYMPNINNALMYMTGKDIDTITIDEIKNITSYDVELYRDYLKKLTKPHSKERLYKMNTINTYLSPCRTFFDFLIEHKVVQSNCFDIKKLKTKETVNHYGSLTESELEGLYDYCLSLKDRGITKKLYFEFLATLTCRKTVAQELKFDDIVRRLDPEDNNYYWVVNSYDKTRIVDRAITDEFYDKLKANFDSYDWVDQKKGFVFNVGDKTLEKTLNDYCKFAGIDKESRNIAQHSLKSTGLDIIQDAFGDINITAKAGGHADIQTTYENYLNKNKHYSQQPSIMLSKKRKKEDLKLLTQEQLLDLINSSGIITLNKICANAEKRGLI